MSGWSYLREYVALPGLAGMSRLYARGVAPGCNIGCVSGRNVSEVLHDSLGTVFVAAGSFRTGSVSIEAEDSPSLILIGEGLVFAADFVCGSIP